MGDVLCCVDVYTPSTRCGLIRQIHLLFISFFNSLLLPTFNPSPLLHLLLQNWWKTAMERVKDSIQTSCSSPLTSPSTDVQLDLWKDTVTVPDRAARKEMERKRLRKLLNQGKKKKRRRLSGNGASCTGSVTTPIHHCHSRDSELICAHVPRKSRSGNRRRCKSWKSIGFDIQVQAQMQSAVDRSSSLSVQDEIEFEIAEVLYGLQKQVSSSDEPSIDYLDNQSISLQDCRLDKAFSSYASVNKAIIKQDTSTAKERSPLCSNLSSNGGLTSEVMSTTMEEAESKQPEKFVFDLNEPPPMESALEGEGFERLTADPEVVFKEEVNLATEDATTRRSVKIKREIRDFDLESLDDIKNGSKQQFQRQPMAYSGPLHQIHMPLGSGHMMAGPLIFPLNQNPKLATNQTGVSVSASPTGNLRFSYPIGAPFLSVSPGNVCTTPTYSSKRMYYSGGKNAQQMPFLNGLSHPSQIILPIHAQQQKHFPFTTQPISLVADIRTSSSPRNVTFQSPSPLHSPNVASMPSGASNNWGQWRYADRHDLQSEGLRNSTPSFSFASSNQSSLKDAAGLALNISMAQNHVVAPGFMDKQTLGSQIPPADRRLQYRRSEVIQKFHRPGSVLGVGNTPAFLGQSGFVLKSCSSVSPASIGANVFDNSVATPNFQLAIAKHNALSAKSTSARLQNQQHQMSHIMAASQRNLVPTVDNQPAIAAKLPTDFSIFSGSLFDKPSHSLRQ